MSNAYEVIAEKRNEVGKAAARRLRRLNDQVPAILYGAEQEPVALTLSHNKIAKSLTNKAFYSHVLSINIDGTEEKAILRAVQRHPVKGKIMHMDFQRITGKEQITVHVPLRFVGEKLAPGVRISGGSISHHMASVEVRCLPAALPEYIEVDISDLELDHSLHLSNLTLPPAVEFPEFVAGAERDLPVVSIHLTRAALAESSEAPVAPAAEVETIKQGKKESEEGE
ncbi:50S ribosomal protein L25/general stress protein Ctc [soil metagenome]